MYDFENGVFTVLKDFKIYIQVYSSIQISSNTALCNRTVID
jgi:hypothetical protein